ncbi:MAG: SRPBCC domain-containing protein [Silvanigrellales bacterium]|nr:SRPBCC domain-containing protein [Silvanigrellales bacterium]
MKANRGGPELFRFRVLLESGFRSGLDAVWQGVGESLWLLLRPRSSIVRACLSWPELESQVEVDLAWYGFFHKPLARVWHALTSDEELSAWFDTNTRLYLEPGGELIALGGIQFRGAFERATAREISPGRHILWKWPLHGTDTMVTWTLSEEFGGTRLIVRHTVPYGARSLFSQQDANEALAHFWKANIVCLKFWLDLGFPPEISRFGEKPKSDLNVSLNIPVSTERAWTLLNDAVARESWWPWSLQGVEESIPSRKLVVRLAPEGGSVAQGEMSVTLEGGPLARDCLVRVESRAFNRGDQGALQEAHERWLTALHAFAVFAVTGEKFPVWCGLNP